MVVEAGRQGRVSTPVRISHLFLCERVVLLHLRSGRDQRRSLALALDVICAGVGESGVMRGRVPSAGARPCLTEQRLVDQEVVLSDADLLQVSRRDGVLERSERRWWLQITGKSKIVLSAVQQMH